MNIGSLAIVSRSFDNAQTWLFALCSPIHLGVSFLGAFNWAGAFKEKNTVQLLQSYRGKTNCFVKKKKKKMRVLSIGLGHFRAAR